MKCTDFTEKEFSVRLVTCFKCRAKFVNSLICRKCGTEMIDDTIFQNISTEVKVHECPDCGYTITK